MPLDLAFHFGKAGTHSNDQPADVLNNLVVTRFDVSVQFPKP